MRRVVIVGASLAGLRTAQALRAEGFRGTLTLVGDEPHLPYDRPPLSKRHLTGAARPEDADLPIPPDLDATWLLGTPAKALDPVGRTVRLADGRELDYDGLVIATGAAARTHPADHVPDGVLTLRGRDDAAALRTRLRTGRRIVVVGGGYLGSEIAGAARGRGLDVTLVVSTAQPLARLVADEVGAYVAELHRAAGIALVTRRTALGFTGNPALTGVVLSDGDTVDADLAVLALGAEPNTGWLAGSGVPVAGGVACDPCLRVLHESGAPLPNVVAAGDIARWPHPLADGAPIALGHWSNAAEQAAAAARTLLHHDDARPFTVVPSFWSDLHGSTLRAVGLPAHSDERRVVRYDVFGRRLEVTYHRAGRLVGAVTVGGPGRIGAYRRILTDELLRAA
ncbi:NAD(P)/FAD-dependent oxidoreductase [Embleya hyalina]|uniref:Pyridine nucleotide-disulfide oxidoreductase n=1 Tax=Embleya hyalina TaxID=516124 RepID=A0A401YF03_9ACTN|nr:FAD/NAD(P)-binding oxidoreductase [Embleya hyalina]GCD93191.1 pyridine nucleotide-disulfide oxidoreductase [Embleya hyalina]